MKSIIGASLPCPSVGSCCDCALEEFGAAMRLFIGLTRAARLVKEDQVEDAAKMYETMYEESFEFMDAWREVRDERKWNELPNSSSFKRPGSKRKSDGQETAGSAAVDCDARPTGEKAKPQRSVENASQMKGCRRPALTRGRLLQSVLSLYEHEESRIWFQS